MVTEHTRPQSSSRRTRLAAGHARGCSWRSDRGASAGERLAGPEVAALVRRAAGGDQPAWDGLVDEFGGLVWAVARAHRLADADAADVAQVTWMRLLENVARLNDPEHVGAWLATTARRECLRVLRAGRRDLPIGDDAPEVASGEPAPADELLATERDRMLRRALARLRDSDRTLLRMLMADPAPAYEEISAALRIPIGSIGPTRARALGRLRAELDAQGTLALLRG
jgi:RNA polymerase sigma factor (sigma-70 family)